MKAQTSKPVVLHDGEGDATWFIGTLMIRKAGATDGNGGVALLDNSLQRGSARHFTSITARMRAFISWKARSISSATDSRST